MAFAYLLTAVGGDGMPEIDSDTNPRRQRLAQPFPFFDDSSLALSCPPSPGVEPGYSVDGFSVLPTN